VLLLTAPFTCLVGWLVIHGFDYYRLAPAQRAFHPLHAQLRPSGEIGIRLGMLGVACFLVIYLYAVRKRWRWLSRIGKTRNWLDFHIVLGIGAPALITFHSAFKMRGLAGLAYWIMVAVVLSGVVGRYLYAQIPRSINAAELSLQEMQTLTEDLSRRLDEQNLVSPEELRPLTAVPSPGEVAAMPLGKALLLMLWYDLMRSWMVARVRRRATSGLTLWLTVGGFLPSRHAGLERVVQLARGRAWMGTKIAFLSKTRQVFNLWHVIHRPFSYSFALLVMIHIGVVVMMGYF
jgi:hypothetical protein